MENERTKLPDTPSHLPKYKNEVSADIPTKSDGSVALDSVRMVAIAPKLLQVVRPDWCSSSVWIAENAKCALVLLPVLATVPDGDASYTTPLLPYFLLLFFPWSGVLCAG